MAAKKKKTDEDTTGGKEAFLGVGAAGDPMKPAERLSPTAPSAMVFGEPVPNEDSTVTTKEDGK